MKTNTKSKSKRRSKPKHIIRKSYQNNKRRSSNKSFKRNKDLKLKRQKKKITKKKMKGGSFNEKCLSNDNGEYIDHKAYEQEFNKRCTLCLSKVNNNILINCKLIECCHTFHYECIRRIFETDKKCPECRANIISYFKTDTDYQNTDISNNNNNSRPNTKRAKRDINITWIKSNVIFNQNSSNEDSNNEDSNNEESNNNIVPPSPVPNLRDYMNSLTPEQRRQQEQRRESNESYGNMFNY
jgi:hypothetical protein